MGLTAMTVSCILYGAKLSLGEAVGTLWQTHRQHQRDANRRRTDAAHRTTRGKLSSVMPELPAEEGDDHDGDGGSSVGDDDDHGGDAGEGEVLTMATIRKKRPAPHRRIVDASDRRFSTATERSQESHDGEGQPEHAPQAAASTHGDDGDLRAIEQRLPDGWVSMESRSRAGQVVYAHSESGARIGEAPTLDTQRADRKDSPDLHAQRTVTLVVYVEGRLVATSKWRGLSAI